MAGPTAWPQFFSNVASGNQNIVTNTETAIATLQNVNNRGTGAPILLTGSAVFAVQAAATSVTLRLYRGGLTGTNLGSWVVWSGTAGTTANADGSVFFLDTPAGDVAGQTYTLSIQSAAAGANWNTINAALTAQS